MRRLLFTAVAVLMLTAHGTTAQNDAATSAGPQGTMAPELAGTWKSEPDTLKLTSDFDRSVWGEDASSVRTVELVVEPSGEGTLTLTKKVVDAAGQTVKASTWVEQARLKIGGAREPVATRVEHDVSVVSAERRYPDDPDYRWPIEGLRVRVATFEDGEDGAIEIRYDTPEGKGSFWETLRRSGGQAPAQRASR